MRLRKDIAQLTFQITLYNSKLTSDYLYTKQLICGVIIINMYAEYLHPELVLFGNFSNENIQIQHPYHIKDNEIIVNQVIDRAPIGAGLNQLAKMINRYKKNQQEEHYGQNDQGQQQQLHQDKWQMKRQQDEDYEQQYEDEDQPDYDGYFQNDPNPYGYQSYGLTMDAQYMPEQLNNLGGISQKQMKRYRNMPLVNIKPKPEEKAGKTIVDQIVKDEDDNESWITEQEQEYYVNEQLEQVSGGFAADIASD